MKNPLRILPFAVCVLAGIAFAGDFKSAIIAGSGSSSLPHVANCHSDSDSYVNADPDTASANGAHGNNHRPRHVSTGIH